jgi:hypothetical protein
MPLALGGNRDGPRSLLHLVHFPILGRTAVGVEQHDLNPGEALMNRRQQFLGVQIAETTIKKKDLPIALLQLGKRVGPAQRLLYWTAAAIKAMDYLRTQNAIGARNQGCSRTWKKRNGCQRTHI